MTASTPYAYRAALPNGGMEVGVVDAPSRAAASALLAGRGLWPLEIAPAPSARDARPALPSGDLALGLRMLATLLEARLPLGRALAAFDELAPPSWRPALPALRESVRQGEGLAGALAAAPVTVPPALLGILRAGEAGSGLAAAVSRAAGLTEERAATRSAIRGALAYPAVLASAGTASVALLVGVVLPRFAAILADLGQPLPTTTRLVLAAAVGVRLLALPGLVTAAAALVLGRAWVGTEQGRERWDALLLGVPVLGAIRRSSATANLTAALSALLESGVPMAAALAHAARAAGDAMLGKCIASARERVIGGARLSQSLSETGAVTPTTVRLVRAGEESGKLAEMLRHASRIETERAGQLTRSAVGVLEPALIVTFGGVVALVAAALLQAVYSVRPVVGAATGAGGA